LRLSAILPTYNRDHLLKEQLDSLLSQTRLPDELIIGDDLSSDGTAQVIKEFAAHAPFSVRSYRNERNEGASRNAERAIEQCSGDVVVICDDDDISLPDRMEAIELEFAKSPETGFVLTNSDLVDPNLRPIGTTLWAAYKFTSREMSTVSADPICTLAKHFVGAGHVISFRNSLTSYILPFPKRLPDGIFFDVWLSLVLASITDITCIPRPLVTHRLHQGQIAGVQALAPFNNRIGQIRSSERKKMAAFAPLLQEVIDRVSSQIDTPRSRQNLASLIAWADHLRMQSSLSRGKSYRILPIVRALFNGRYHRYSRGFLTAARDLLILQ
jgi:glycosyltransferase involved in cell wall biosynthesis